MESSTVYSSIGARSNFINRASLAVRREIYHAVDARTDLASLRNVLDVGVTSDCERVESNFFEAMFPNKDRLTAFSDQDASWLEERHPGLTFVRGDGRAMPFPDNSFDLVFSNAVL